MKKQLIGHDFIQCHRILLRHFLSPFILLGMSVGLNYSCTKSPSRVGDSSSHVTEKNSIRLGTIAGPETDVMEVVKRIAKEKYELEIELVSFSDFVTPNIALDDGSIDANAYQHLPFLQEAIADRGYDISPIGETFLYPVTAYSTKLSSKNSISKGARIAIPNDPSNEGRALLLLEAQGLIKLDKKAGLKAMPCDIIENPMELKFVELDAAQLPRVLDDVEISIVNTAFSKSANLESHSVSLFSESTDSAYVNLVVSKNGSSTAQWTKKLIAAIHNNEVLLAAKTAFGDQAIAAWKTEIE